MSDDDLDRETVLVASSPPPSSGPLPSRPVADHVLQMTRLALRLVSAAREGDTKGFVALVRDLRPALSGWKDALRGESDPDLSSATEAVERSLSELLQSCKAALAASAGDAQRTEAVRRGKNLAAAIQSWKAVHEGVVAARKKSSSNGPPKKALPQVQALPQTKGQEAKVQETKVQEKPKVVEARGQEKARGGDGQVLREEFEALRRACEAKDEMRAAKAVNGLLEGARRAEVGKAALESIARLMVLKTKPGAFAAMAEEASRLAKSIGPMRRDGDDDNDDGDEDDGRPESLSISEEQQDDPEWLVVDSDGSLLGASVNQLVYRLAQGDEQFVEVFFDTFQLFVGCEELFAKLQEWFLIASVKPQKMFVVLQAWVVRSFDDWDETLVDAFCGWLRKKCETKVAEKLLQTVQKLTASFNIALLEEARLEYLHCLPSNDTANVEAFLGLEAQVFIEQVCLVSGDLFRSLSLRQLRSGFWNDKKTRHKAVSVVLCQDFQAGLMALVQQSILGEPSLRTRQKTVRKWIRIASVLTELHNHFAAASVIDGLQCAAVARLKFSFALIPAKETKQLADAAQLVCPRMRQFARLDTNLQQLVGGDKPVVPLLSRALASVLFALDGIPNVMGERRLVNWKKMEALSRATADVARWKDRSLYSFERNDLAASFLYKLQPGTQSNDQLMETSLKLEPRGVTDKSELVQ